MNSGTLQPKHHSDNKKNTSMLRWCRTSLTGLFYLEVYNPQATDISGYNIIL